MRGRFVAWPGWRVTSPGRRRAGGLIGEDAFDVKHRDTWSHFGPEVALERWVEPAHRRHRVERSHEEAKGPLGWDQDQGRASTGTRWAWCWRPASWSGRSGGAARSAPARDDRGGLFPPRPDRRRVPLSEVHRQVCDWLRLRGIKELLIRELMTAPERIPA
jgi:hypothetical protein